MPATSPILGKRSLSIHHDCGWTFPCNIREALEGLDEVPLPARYSCRMVPGGLALDVVTREERSNVFHTIENALHEHGIPVQELRLLTDRQHLSHVLPLRCDLREYTFPSSGPDGILIQKMNMQG